MGKDASFVCLGFIVDDEQHEEEDDEDAAESVEHDDNDEVVFVVVAILSSDFDFKLRCSTKFVADVCGRMNLGLGRVGGGFAGGVGCCF